MVDFHVARPVVDGGNLEDAARFEQLRALAKVYLLDRAECAVARTPLGGAE